MARGNGDMDSVSERFLRQGSAIYQLLSKRPIKMPDAQNGEACNRVQPRLRLFSIAE